MAKKVRIDRLLVDRGLAASRDRAQRLILAGQVLVDDRVIDKAGTQVDPDGALRLRGADHPYVGRGGLKLQGALADFGLEVRDLRCLDVGASTGGFTDCLLQQGASHVIAVDVGTNQLAWKLRQDPRVTSLEQTDARSIKAEMLSPLGGPVDLVVMDASFISLKLLLDPLVDLLEPGARVLALIKPQFEVGRAQVARGGVVRDEQAREEAVQGICAHLESLGLEVDGVRDSQLEGARSGNREVFVLAGFPGQC